MGFADDWGNVYNKSILEFTGRKKVAVRELDGVRDGATDLVKSLATLDANDPTQGSPQEKPKRLKAFAAEQKNLTKAAAKYGAILDVAIKKTDKNIWPDAYRELKVMRKKLDAITSKVESRLVICSKEYIAEQKKIGEKIAKTTEKERAKGATDDEVGEATNFLKQQRMMIGWTKLTKAALAKAVATAQAIKADPTAQTYNTEMWSGGRDMTQQMVNLIKLVQDPKCPKEVVKLMDGLPPHRNHLAEFGDGAKRKIDVNTPKNQVEALNKEFSQLVKAMVPYFDKMSKYLTKHKI
jgi:hypothetical protein